MQILFCMIYSSRIEIRREKIFFLGVDWSSLTSFDDPKQPLQLT